MAQLVKWSGDGLSGNLTTSSAGTGDTAPSFITGATPTIEPIGDRPPAIRFAQDATTVNYAAWTFSASDLYAYAVRVYANLTAFPASTQIALWKFVNAADTLGSWALAVTDSGLLRIMDKNGGTAATSTAALTAGTWYRIEATVNGESTTVNAYEGESTTVAATVSATLAAPVAGGKIWLGNNFGSPHADPFYVDDLRVDDVPSLIGPVTTFGGNYATLAELKQRLAGVSDTTDDALFTAALNSASRAVEKYTGRQFNDSETASARVFYPDSSRRCLVDDFHTTTGLTVKTDDDDDGTYEITLSSSDYQLEPLNGFVDGESGWPYNTIVAVESQTFPTSTHRASVEVTARWGWAEVPAAVKEATLIVAEELAKLKDAPFGVSGWTDFGIMRVRDNPFAARLLNPYRRHRVLVG